MEADRVIDRQSRLFDPISFSRALILLAPPHTDLIESLSYFSAFCYKANTRRANAYERLRVLLGRNGGLRPYSLTRME